MNEVFVIRRGDQCTLPYRAICGNCVLTPEYVDEIEIVVNTLRKLYKSNEIDYDKDTYCFLFPLSQSETLDLEPNCIGYPTQIRIKTKVINPGDRAVVYGYNGPDVVVLDSLSEYVLNG